MNDTLEGTLPVGCFVKSIRRVVTTSKPKIIETIVSTVSVSTGTGTGVSASVSGGSVGGGDKNISPRNRESENESKNDNENGNENKRDNENETNDEKKIDKNETKNGHDRSDNHNDNIEKNSERSSERSSERGSVIEKKTEIDTTVFLQLLACVGAKVRVADAWIFESITHIINENPDENNIIIAAERVNEPKVESQPGLVLMVLYPGGITLRASPHMSAAKVDHIVKMYECHSAQGLISTSDGMESFALLGGGAWLPCKAPGGLEVAVRYVIGYFFIFLIFFISFYDV